MTTCSPLWTVWNKAFVHIFCLNVGVHLTLESGDNIIIYPEDSTNGYLAELEGFHKGFVALAALCEKKGMNVPIYVSYYRKSDLTCIIDAPVYYKDLAAKGESKEEIAERLLDRCNELGKMQFPADGAAEERVLAGNDAPDVPVEEGVAEEIAATQA